MDFDLEIISPEKIVFQAKASKLIVPSLLGQLTILNHHIPLFAVLSQGIVKIIDNKNREHKISISKGIIQVKKEKVILAIQSLEYSNLSLDLKVQKAEIKAQKNISQNKQKLNQSKTVNPISRRSFINFQDINLKKIKRTFV